MSQQQLSPAQQQQQQADETAFLFAPEPIRCNILQTTQIQRELSSLHSSIRQLEGSIQAHPLLQQQQAQAASRATDPSFLPVHAKPLTTRTPRGREEEGQPWKTSQVYTVQGKLPRKFEEPALWRTTPKRQNILYTTTSNDYGLVPPSIHEMPTIFAGKSGKFTEGLDGAGPYRNFSLNTK